MKERGLARKKERPHSQPVKGDVKLGQVQSIAKQCDEKSDILTIEMTLFANAPLLAERFSVGKF